MNPPDVMPNADVQAEVAPAFNPRAELDNLKNSLKDKKPEDKQKEMESLRTKVLAMAPEQRDALRKEIAERKKMESPEKPAEGQVLNKDEDLTAIEQVLNEGTVPQQPTGPYLQMEQLQKDMQEHPESAELKGKFAKIAKIPILGTLFAPILKMMQQFVTDAKAGQKYQGGLTEEFQKAGITLVEAPKPKEGEEKLGDAPALVANDVTGTRRRLALLDPKYNVPLPEFVKMMKEKIMPNADNKVNWVELRTAVDTLARGEYLKNGQSLVTALREKGRLTADKMDDDQVTSFARQRVRLVENGKGNFLDNAAFADALTTQLDERERTTPMNASTLMDRLDKWNGNESVKTATAPQREAIEKGPEKK